MPRYDSSKPTPDGQPPEADEEKLGFFSFLMPAAHNAVQAAKWNADQANEDERSDRADPRKSKQDYLNDAHNALDGCDKKLNQAKEDTEDRMAERDKDSDEDSPRKRGWLW